MPTGEDINTGLQVGGNIPNFSIPINTNVLSPPPEFTVVVQGEALLTISGNNPREIPSRGVMIKASEDGAALYINGADITIPLKKEISDLKLVLKELLERIKLDDRYKDIIKDMNELTENTKD